MGELSVTGTPPTALSGQRYAHGMENAVPAAPAEGAAAEPSGPVWRFLIKPRWLGWHLLMVVCFWGMLWLGDWQLHRALAGNGLSWAYTFEWPLFACFAVVFWAKTIKDEFQIKRGGAAGSASSEIGLDDLPVSVPSRPAPPRPRTTMTRSSAPTTPTWPGSTPRSSATANGTDGGASALRRSGDDGRAGEGETLSEPWSVGERETQ
jgi:hypothetical protein